MTLEDFRNSVESEVERLSKARQVARFYPTDVPLQAPFLTPPPANLPVAIVPK